MISKFLFEAIDMGDLPNLPVTVATDWLAIIVSGFISVLGTLVGVILGFRASRDDFYNQKIYDQKFLIYGELTRLIYESNQYIQGNMNLVGNDEGIPYDEVESRVAKDYWDIIDYMSKNIMWVDREVFTTVRVYHWYRDSEYLEKIPMSKQVELHRAYQRAIQLIGDALDIPLSKNMDLD